MLDRSWSASSASPWASSSVANCSIEICWRDCPATVLASPTSKNSAKIAAALRSVARANPSPSARPMSKAIRAAPTARN